MTGRLGVGLYGSNGHQIHPPVRNHPDVQLVAAVLCDGLPLTDDPTVRHCASLEELLADDRVELVSLCSPRRADQAEAAVRCVEAGKHVHAEKPAALTEEHFDRILAAAQAAGRSFREMADTAWEQPYAAVAEVVRTGVPG